MQQNFLKLGCTHKFIEKCRISAHKSRMNEIKKGNLIALQELPFASHSNKIAVKQEPQAMLSLTYHPCMLKLQHRLAEMGIRLAYASNSKLQQQLKHKFARGVQSKGSVFRVNCSFCPQIYIYIYWTDRETGWRQYFK